MSRHPNTRIGDVPIAPFRERFEQLQRQGVTAGEIAKRLGWYTSRGAPDGGRVSRTMGLRDTHWTGYHGEKRHGPREAIMPKTAEALMDAMDLDPVDVGL